MSSTQTISQYRTRNRVVLIFSPSPTDSRFTNQLAEFAERRSDLEERDIVILQIVGSNDLRLRNQFRVGPADFAVVLIGKDGTEKHRWSNCAPVDQINHRIDRMPMRKTEMRQQEAIRTK